MSEQAIPRRALVLLRSLTLVWGTNWPLFAFAVREISVWTFRAFAVTLAGVTALQAASERAAADLRAPALATVGSAGIVHDGLDRDLAALRDDLGGAGADYERTADALAELEAGLDALTLRVAEIEGATARLPDRIALPSAPRVAAATKPATQATTGASGR